MKWKTTRPWIWNGGSRTIGTPLRADLTATFVCFVCVVIPVVEKKYKWSILNEKLIEKICKTFCNQNPHSEYNDTQFIHSSSFIHCFYLGCCECDDKHPKVCNFLRLIGFLSMFSLLSFHYLGKYFHGITIHVCWNMDLPVACRDEFLIC